MVVTLGRSPTQVIDPPIDPVYEPPSDRKVQYNNEILVLVSAPLVDPRESPIEDLNIKKEVNAIVRALEDVEAPLSVKITVKVASVDTLLQVFSDRYKPLVIHFMGHGELWGDDVVLNLEDHHGKSDPYGRTELRRLFNTLDAPPCQLAVLNACYSERLANEFLKAEVPHVVAINAEDKILSLATQSFAKQFYYALFNEQSVSQSFAMGCESIRSSRELRQRIDPESYERRNQTESVKYQLLPRNNRVHEQSLAVATSNRGDISVQKWENTNVPAVDRFFVGRRSELHDMVKILNEHQCLMIHGMGGMGKTAIAEALGRWYHERQYWKDGIWKVELREATNLATALSKIQLELQLIACESCRELGKAFRRKRCLLILDDVDQLRESDPFGLNELIETLSDCEDLGLIITGRQDLDNRSLSITQNYELSVLRLPDAKAAFLKYAPSLAPDASAEAGRRSKDALFSFLDGYPLPIRLAAAFMKESRTDQLQDLVEALNLDPMETLAPLRDEAKRENSLQVTLNLSFQVLPDSAKQMFPVLALFPGGISKELAQSGSIGKRAYQDLVTLLNYSMAELSSKDSSWRVKLPEPARAYAEEKQTRSLDQIAPTVLAYFYDFAQEVSEQLEQEPDSSEALRVLQAEQANLATFLRWGYENEESIEEVCYCARITALLMRQWRLLMPDMGAVEALQHSLIKAKILEDLEAEADVHRSLGDALLRQAGIEAAQEEYAQALALYDNRLAVTYNDLERAKYHIKRGDIYLQLQAYDSAVVVYEAAYDIYQAQQITRLAAPVQVKLSEVSRYQGQVEQALLYLEVAKELYELIDMKPALRRVQSLVNQFRGIPDRLSMKHQDFDEILDEQVSIQMIAIPGGGFEMGSSEEVGYKAEYPKHWVKLIPFYMSETPITQAQWKAVMGTNPSSFSGDHLPVESICWDDAQEFCKKLSVRSGKKFRLPSEAEWEYACRAGTQTKYSFGGRIDSSLANFGRHVGQTSPVGQYPPNDFGLYDMHGNVWEWCQDTWHDNYEGAPADGSAWVGNDEHRILRGGSWINLPGFCRSAYRDGDVPGVRLSNGLGFRVVLSLPRNF